MADCTRYKNLLDKSECIQIARRALVHDSNINIMELINYNIKSVSDETIGFLGEYFILSMDINLDGKLLSLSFFIKSLPVNDLEHRNTVSSMGVLSKEATLYSTLFNEMDKYSIMKWHPNLYYKRSDLMVLTNLTDIGYSKKIGVRDFDINHIKCALITMANMHAASITLERNTSTNIGDKFKTQLREITILGENSWYTIGLKALKVIASTHPKLQSEKYQIFIKNKFLNRLMSTIEMIKFAEEFSCTVCHRDVWDGNILFNYDKNKPNKPISAIFVDFQTTCYLPPCLDVLMLIILNTQKNYRDQVFDDCIHFYYERLKEILNKFEIDINEILSWTTYQRSIDCLKLIPLTLNGVFVPFTFLSQKYLLEAKKNSLEYQKLLQVDRSDFIMKIMEKDENYRNRLLDITEELVLYTMA